jgi:cobalamin biosynthesis protein CobD/CbiB
MAFRRAPVRPFPAFVGEARWPWWHPVFWLGTVLQIVATVLVASRVQQWADAQESYVSAESTM